jgi:hypothetical protein
MSIADTAFWVAITVFSTILATGLYFWLNAKTKKVQKSVGIVLTCVGAVGLTIPFVVSLLAAKVVTAQSSSAPPQQNTVNGSSNNTGNVNQSGDHNTAVIGNNNKVGNTYNVGSNNSGWLRPGHDPTPPTRCQVPELSVKGPQQDDLVIFFGNTVGWINKNSPFPWVILKIAGHPVLTLEKKKTGEIAISGEVYNPQDDAIVVLANNKFTTSTEAFVVDSTSTSLRVTVKHLNETVLNVQYLNPHTVRISGHFYYQRHNVLIGTDKSIVDATSLGGDNCFGNAHTLFEID